MNFYCITKPNPKGVGQLFKKACEDRSISYQEIDPNPNKFNILNFPRLKDGDAIYRASANNLNAKKIEYSLYSNKVAALYSFPEALFTPYTPLKLEKGNIPMPKTIFLVPSNRNFLKEYSDYLGGFPLIIKIMGSKEGVGVIRVDSPEALYSLTDYIFKLGEDAILRSYIDVRESARLIVLGNKVVASIKYKASKGDFRSNRKTGLENIEAASYDSEVENIAIEAVKLMGFEFGGVDILIDQEKKCYVLEVNFPCHFGDAQITTGIDIAGLMVDYLAKKSKSINR